MALPALLVFVAFAIVPLVSVLLLSFPSWDSISVIRPAGFDSLAGQAHRPGPAARALGDVRGHGPVVGGADPLSILLGVFLAGHQPVT